MQNDARRLLEIKQILKTIIEAEFNYQKKLAGMNKSIAEYGSSPEFQQYLIKPETQSILNNPQLNNTLGDFGVRPYRGETDFSGQARQGSGRDTKADLMTIFDKNIDKIVNILEAKEKNGKITIEEFINNNPANFFHKIGGRIVKSYEEIANFIGVKVEEHNSQITNLGTIQGQIDRLEEVYCGKSSEKNFALQKKEGKEEYFGGQGVSLGGGGEGFNRWRNYQEKTQEDQIKYQEQQYVVKTNNKTKDYDVYLILNNGEEIFLSSVGNVKSSQEAFQAYTKQANQTAVALNSSNSFEEKKKDKLSGTFKYGENEYSVKMKPDPFGKPTNNYQISLIIEGVEPFNVGILYHCTSLKNAIERFTEQQKGFSGEKNNKQLTKEEKQEQYICDSVSEAFKQGGKNYADRSFKTSEQEYNIENIDGNLFSVNNDNVYQVTPGEEGGFYISLFGDEIESTKIDGETTEQALTNYLNNQKQKEEERFESKIKSSNLGFSQAETKLKVDKIEKNPPQTKTFEHNGKSYVCKKVRENEYNITDEAQKTKKISGKDVDSFDKAIQEFKNRLEENKQQESKGFGK
jgi:hypothetical protein